MSSYWPRTGKAYRIPGTPLPPQAGAPMVLSLFHFSWWTVGISLVVCAVFCYAAYKNRTVLWALRRLRSKMRSGVVAARPRLYRQRFTFDQHISDLDFKSWGGR